PISIDRLCIGVNERSQHRCSFK
ncbi:hypothetical protein VCHC59B1_3279B, partial [Vibrio cholerae HC-59B1]